jgi:hypothetical protein
MKRHHASLLLFVLFLTSCSNSPKAEVAKEPEKPPEPVTGRYAFHQVYIAARTWATDMQGLRVTNIPVGTQIRRRGKSYAWEVTFVSLSKGKQRMYTYSVLEAEGNRAHGRLSATWKRTTCSEAKRACGTFQALKIDSDAALRSCSEKERRLCQEKNPDKPITFLLEQTPRHPNLTWRVIWGPSFSASNYSVYIDASTGLYMETNAVRQACRPVSSI